MQTISRFVLSALVALSLASTVIAQSGPSKDDLFKKVEKAAKGKKLDEQRETVRLGREYLSQFGKDQDDKAKKVFEFLVGIKNNWREQISKIVQANKPNEMLKAYDLAKIMLTDFSGDTDPFITGTKTFMAKNREAFFDLLIDANRLSDAFLLGEEILNEKPENLYVKINMPILAQDLWLKQKEKSFVRDGVAYAQEAVKDIEAGANSPTYTPFKSREEAHANMYWLIGILKAETDLPTAAMSLHKANSMWDEFMKRSYGFVVLASYYEARYNNRIKEFGMKYPSGRVPNDVADKEEAVRRELLDRLLDAYGRAVKNARSENSPAAGPLTEAAQAVYQRRKGSDAGFENFVNNIMSTPMLSFQ